MVNEPLLLDIKDVKKLLSIGNNNVYIFIKENKIPYLKIGNKFKVYRKGLYNWIEKNLENY